MSQPASDLQALRTEQPQSSELLRLAAQLISADVRDERDGL